MSVLLFLAILFSLVLVHEWGHFIVAKKTGMRVDEFGIGFPPKLFGIRYRGTLYTLNALPIGGFVKIYGENAADAAGDEVLGKDTAGSFTSKSRLAQALVLVAGVVMNVLFAWGLFTLALMIGVPTAVSEEAAGAGASLVVQAVVPDSPASNAGLPLGAIITELVAEGTTLTHPTPSTFRALTEGSSDEPVKLTYTHDNQTETIELTPKTGVIVDETDRPAVGVSLALVETKSAPLLSALGQGAKQTGQMLVAITTGIVTLISGAVTGTADLSSVTGPVGIVGLVGQAADFGFSVLLTFTAMISLNLAVINLLPFPALDGGRLLFVAIEALTRRTIAPVWVMRLNALGFASLMLLMVVVTWHDIVRLF